MTLAKLDPWCRPSGWRLTFTTRTCGSSTSRSTARSNDAAHLPGAIFVDMHVDLARPGTRPETGAARRQYLVPTREDVPPRWRRGASRRVSASVFYDDGNNRQGDPRLLGHAPVRFPARASPPPRWQGSRSGRPGTPDHDRSLEAGAGRSHGTAPRARRFAHRTADQVLAWSREASAVEGPTRLLDVRSIDEFLGTDVRAARGGRIPGAKHRIFSDFRRSRRTAPERAGGARDPARDRRRSRRAAGHLLPVRRPGRAGLVVLHELPAWTAPQLRRVLEEWATGPTFRSRSSFRRVQEAAVRRALRVGVDDRSHAQCPARPAQIPAVGQLERD